MVYYRLQVPYFVPCAFAPVDFVYFSAWQCSCGMAGFNCVVPTPIVYIYLLALLLPVTLSLVHSLEYLRHHSL